MADTSLTFVEDQVFNVEGPQPFTVGESIAFVCTFSWLAGFTGTPTCAIYKEDTSSDLAATYLSGSVSVSGNAVTSKIVSGLVSGQRYVLVISGVPSTATITIKRKVLLICQGAGDGQ